ncbi:MAG: DUF6057 family protein [Bacteroides sp.]|nr:DUF6057 family protein [Bacteroides sp.]
MKRALERCEWIGAMTLLWMIYVYATQEFRFYSLECNHLFVFDGWSVGRQLPRTGGVALLLSSFFTQFMKEPWVGVLLSVLCYALVAWLLCAVGKRQGMPRWLEGFAFLPVVFLFLCLENNIYRFQGHIAYVLAVVALWGYVCLPVRRVEWRVLWGIGLSVLLYQVAGSVALVFAVSAVIYDALFARGKAWMGMAYPTAVVLVGYLSLIDARVETVEKAFTPLMYYDGLTTYYVPIYAWVMLSVWLLLVRLFRGKEPGRRILTVGVMAAGCVCTFGLAHYFYSAVHGTRYYRALKEQHYAVLGDWDAIVALADGQSETHYISYLHLALAEKGQLIERLYDNHPQVMSFFMGKRPKQKDELRVLSRVYWEWGYVAAAQQAAFEANQITPGGCNPEELKLLVLTNLTFGAYAVAEKYIALLEKTLFYKGWATSHRRFLYNDSLVETDVLLGEKRRALPATNRYLSTHGLVCDLEEIVNANPRQPIARQFYVALLMLTNDKERLKALEQGATRQPKN